MDFIDLTEKNYDPVGETLKTKHDQLISVELKRGVDRKVRDESDKVASV